jgi:hypothetical protein
MLSFSVNYVFKSIKQYIMVVKLNYLKKFFKGKNEKSKESSQQERKEKVTFDQLTQMGAIPYTKVLRESIEILDEEDKAALENLMERNDVDGDDVISFLRQKVPNFEELACKAIKGTMNDISSIIAEARKRAAMKIEANKDI